MGDSSDNKSGSIRSWIACEVYSNRSRRAVRVTLVWL